MRKLCIFFIFLGFISCAKQEAPKDQVKVLTEEVFAKLEEHSINVETLNPTMNELLDSLEYWTLHSKDFNKRCQAIVTIAYIADCFYDKADSCSIQYFTNTILPRYDVIKNQWQVVYNKDAGAFIMSHDILYLYDDGISPAQIDLFIKNENESFACLTLPYDAEWLGGIMFSKGDNLTSFDECVMPEDAIEVTQNDNRLCFVFPLDTIIHKMMTYDMMYVAYVLNDTTLSKQDRLQNHMIVLETFQKQFNEMSEMMNLSTSIYKKQNYIIECQDRLKEDWVNLDDTLYWENQIRQSKIAIREDSFKLDSIIHLLYK